jgi:uncharacterized RDD family membrane protein YckC
MAISEPGFYVAGERYDPAREPELYAGVLGRRMLAFIVDVVLIGLFDVVAALVVVTLGLVTFGVGWFLFALPIFAIVGVLYVALTLGGPKAATPGMRLMGLTIRASDGSRIGPILAGIHVILYWASISLLTPFILLIALFSNKKRLLHDMLIGAVVLNRAPLEATGR